MGVMIFWWREGEGSYQDGPMFMKDAVDKARTLSYKGYEVRVYKLIETHYFKAEK